MTEHLTEQQLARFRAQTLPAAELPAADEHLAACPACRQMLGEAQPINTLTSFFQAETARVNHPSYEQIAAFIDQQLPITERRHIEAHLAICPACLTEVEDLRAFDAKLASYPAQAFAPSAATPVAPMPAPSVLDKLRDSWQSFVQTFSGLSWQLAGATAALMLAIAAAALFVNQRERNPNIAIVPTPSPLVTPTVLPNATPLPASSSELPPQVVLALRTERLKLPAEIAGLAPRTGNLMGSNDQDETVVLIAPTATFVNTEKPTLRWQALAGATRYRVQVTDRDFDEVARIDDLTATQWTLPKALARGQKYSWQVTAYRDGKEALSPSANFQVLDKTQAAALAAVQKNLGANHVALGVLYAEAGLLDDAAREFQTEPKTGPQAAPARKLLQNLRAQRQAVTARPKPK